MSKFESDIKKKILDRLGGREDVRVWGQATGKLYDRWGNMISFGKVGSADITGYVMGTGTRIEIEVKRPGEKQRPDQVDFGDAVSSGGVIYFVTTSPDDAEQRLVAAMLQRGLTPAPRKP